MEENTNKSPILQLYEELQNKKSNNEKLKDNENWTGIPKYNELGMLNPAYIHYNKLDSKTRQNLIRNQVTKYLSPEIAKTVEVKPATQFYESGPVDALGAFMPISETSILKVLNNIDDNAELSEQQMRDYAKLYSKSNPSTKIENNMDANATRRVLNHELGHLISKVGKDEGMPIYKNRDERILDADFPSEYYENGDEVKEISLDATKAYLQNLALRQAGYLNNIQKIRENNLNIDSDTAAYLFNENEPIARLFENRLEDIAIHGNKGTSDDVKFMVLNEEDGDFGFMLNPAYDSLALQPIYDKMGYRDDPYINKAQYNQDYVNAKQYLVETPNPKYKNYTNESGLNILEDRAKYQQMQDIVDKQNAAWERAKNNKRQGKDYKYIPYIKPTYYDPNIQAKYNPYIDAEPPRQLIGEENYRGEDLNDAFIRNMMYQMIDDRKKRGIDNILPTAVVGGGL